MVNTNKANELKVGIMVLICLGLGLVVALTLSDWDQWFEPKNTLTFKVPYQKGIGGITAGWPVTVGGVAVGSVERIWSVREPVHAEDIEETENSEVAESQQPREASEDTKKMRTYTYFQFSVPSKYDLYYDDCELAAAAQPIGGAGELKITNFGSKGKILKDGDKVFRKSLGKSDMAMMMANAKKVVGNLQEITKNLKSVLNKARLEKIMVNIQKITENLKSVSDKERFEKIIANIHTFTENLKDISDKERFDKILANVGKITEDLKDVSSKTRKTVSVSQPQLERIVANIREASESLKQAIREIRWSPWRLLHKPSKRELRTQNLLTAARAFSSGASDVQATTSRLEGLLEVRGDDMAVDDAELIKTFEELKASMAKFDEAEKNFFKRLGRR